MAHGLCYKMINIGAKSRFKSEGLTSMEGVEGTNGLHINLKGQPGDTIICVAHLFLMASSVFDNHQIEVEGRLSLNTKIL